MTGTPPPAHSDTIPVSASTSTASVGTTHPRRSARHRSQSESSADFEARANASLANPVQATEDDALLRNSDREISLVNPSTLSANVTTVVDRSTTPVEPTTPRNPTYVVGNAESLSALLRQISVSDPTAYARAILTAPMRAPTVTLNNDDLSPPSTPTMDRTRPADRFLSARGLPNPVLFAATAENEQRRQARMTFDNSEAPVPFAFGTRPYRRDPTMPGPFLRDLTPEPRVPVPVEAHRPLPPLVASRHSFKAATPEKL
jgi:hypothetical protein